jgi:hypothetical protein
MQRASVFAREAKLLFSKVLEITLMVRFTHIQYGTIKRQRPIYVGLFQQNITNGKLTKTYNNPYTFLKIKVQTLLFDIDFTKRTNILDLNYP